MISVPGKLKLSTITGDYTGDRTLLGRVADEMKTISLSFAERFPKEDEKPVHLLLLETASPNFKTSWVGFMKEARLLNDSPLKNPLLLILATFNAKKLIDLFKTINFLDSFPLSSFDNCSSKEPKVDEQGKEIFPVLGQLSTKEEAAGKIRVFAIVDIWTQSALKPLHDRLFTFLRSLPNDGTFDQHASVRRAREKANIANQSFGYDLSAATDRLPIALQQVILDS